MGSVWVAKNLALDTLVALKLIRADVRSAVTEDRLLMEARAAAKLRHPAIVRVFDFGETEHGDPYIVMELLEGETLADSLERRERAPATRAVQLLLPIADALAAAHDQSIVHRDLKPENIFLARTSHGVQPKILDFGIAKIQEDSIVTTFTRATAVVGSPEYMSPEQARGSRYIDQRADVWAFAVVLYELIAGVRPFAGDYNAVLLAIAESDPRPFTELGVGDSDLWNMVAVGLRRPPEERWRSMRDFGRALAGWLWEQGIKEDACNASLEATWLASISKPPSEDVFSAPKSTRQVEVIPAQIVFEEEPPPSTERATGLSVTAGANVQEDDTPRRGRWLLRLSVLAVLLSAGLGGALWFKRTTGFWPLPAGMWEAPEQAVPASTPPSEPEAKPIVPFQTSPALPQPPSASAKALPQLDNPAPTTTTKSDSPAEDATPRATRRSKRNRAAAAEAAPSEQELKTPW